MRTILTPCQDKNMSSGFVQVSTLKLNMVIFCVDIRVDPIENVTSVLTMHAFIIIYREPLVC